MKYIGPLGGTFPSRAKFEKWRAEELDKLGKRVTVRRLSRADVVRAIDLCWGNKSEAARLLGIARRTLYRIYELKR
jgi:ActR/RegA family two-component response regulator